jgi:hypothetical protein
MLNPQVLQLSHGSLSSGRFKTDKKTIIFVYSENAQKSIVDNAY